jgi:8-oxo-dGTP pyrophosphatase MutT (NUDIX family)
MRLAPVKRIRPSGTFLPAPLPSSTPAGSRTGDRLCFAAVSDSCSAFIEVYVFRRRGRRVEFLCLRRGRVRFLPGVWQPVTGRCRPRERGLAAAAREVREETGLEPLRWWALEAPTVFYDASRDRVRTYPRFVAEAGPDAAVRLSGEHVDWAFLPATEAGRRYLWESQRRGLEDAQRQVLRDGPLADALEVTSLLAVPADRKRAGARRTRPRKTRPA